MNFKFSLLGLRLNRNSRQNRYNKSEVRRLYTLHSFHIVLSHQDGSSIWIWRTVFELLKTSFINKILAFYTLGQTIDRSVSGQWTERMVRVRQS